jgi:hypothetical protein
VGGYVLRGKGLGAPYSPPARSRAGRASRRGVGAYPDGAMVDSAYPRPTPPPAYTNLRR